MKIFDWLILAAVATASPPKTPAHREVTPEPVTQPEPAGPWAPGQGPVEQWIPVTAQVEQEAAWVLERLERKAPLVLVQGQEVPRVPAQEPEERGVVAAGIDLALRSKSA